MGIFAHGNVVGDGMDQHAQGASCTLAKERIGGRLEVWIQRTCVEKAADAQNIAEHGASQQEAGDNAPP